MRFGVQFKMAIQWAVCLMVIILASNGCYSQPACGRSVINSRILGGQDAASGSWPWHAAIEYQGLVFCQGSLINEQWVLTAAHCSRSYLIGAVVHLGYQSLNGSNPNEVTRRVRGIFCHQDFNPSTYENDICLLMLSSPVDFTNYIQPICLASENSTFYDGLSSWVTGFGISISSIDIVFIPDTLQEVNIPIIGNNKCTCYYNDIFSYISITENNICAGSENGPKEAFVYDEGAALVTKKDSVWVQSGIVSFVYGSLISNSPGIYTRVSQYQNWISNIVNGTEPGFVAFSSPGNDSSLNYTCQTSPPTTTTTTTPDTNPIDPFFTTTTTTTTPDTSPIDSFFTTPPTTGPVTTTDDSVFGSCENLIPFTRFLSLLILVLFLQFFVGSG